MPRQNGSQRTQIGCALLATVLTSRGAMAQVPPVAPVAPVVQVPQVSQGGQAVQPAPSTPAGGESAQPAPIEVVSEAVEGLDVQRARAVSVLRVSLEDAARAVTDFGRYAEFLPHVRESRVVRRNRALTDVYLQVPINQSFGVVWSLVRMNAQRSRDQMVLTGEAVDGNMDRFEMRCVLRRMPGAEPSTQMEFSLLALPRLPLPASVFTREMATNARRVVDTMRSRVEQARAVDSIRAAGAEPGAGVPPNASAQSANGPAGH